MADWCEAHDITLDQWWRLVEREARLRWVREVTDSEVREGLADELRLAGAYPDLLARARQKRSLLERQGRANPALSALAVPADEVLRWYFCDRLGLEDVPDTAASSLTHGFADDEAFRRALRPRVLLRHEQGRGGDVAVAPSCSAVQRRIPYAGFRRLRSD